MGHRTVHFEIMGRDAASLQKFYAELFGWKVAAPAGPELGLYGLVEGASSGLPGATAQEPGGGRRVTLCVQVPDLQATLDRAVAMGGRVAMPPTEVPGAGVTSALFSDPEGNITGLIKG